MTAFLMLAVVLFETANGGVSVKVDAESAVVDPAKSVFLRVEVVSPPGKAVQLPDLRDRVVGFSLAEDYAEETEMTGYAVDTVWLTMSGREAEEQGYEWEEG